MVDQNQHHPLRINNPIEEKMKYWIVRENLVMEAPSEDNAHQTGHLAKTISL